MQPRPRNNMTINVVNVIGITLFLMTSLHPLIQATGDKEDCLKVKADEDCSIAVTYPEYLDNLECNVLVPTEDGALLKSAPQLVVVNPKGEFPAPVLVLMYDPDVPTTGGEGFVHWVARGKMYKDGTISDLDPLPELDYFPPSPPESDGGHRYQFFVFQVGADRNIAAAPDPYLMRLDHLCKFLARNDLPAPIASTQFRYKS